MPLAVKLNFEKTNNMAEYEACIAEMEALQELGVKEAEVFRDSLILGSTSHPFDCLWFPLPFPCPLGL